MLAVANPIFVTSEETAQVVFEVFEVDATSLKLRLGKPALYGYDSAQPPFWATLTALEPCQSTHMGLALMRDRPTLRGTLTIAHAPAGVQ